MRVAVPEGASALFGWCSSTISTESKNRAAWAAKRIERTAPIPKLGTTMTPSSGFGSSQPRIVSSISGVIPLVPTTQWMFWSIQNRMFSATVEGWVKSTATWVSASASENSQSPSSTIATRSRSSAPSTARQTSPPIRPRAPSTPTRSTSSSGRGSAAVIS